MKKSSNEGNESSLLPGGSKDRHFDSWADAQLFDGPEGRLALVWDSRTLPSLRTAGVTHWLMPVTDPGLVKAAEGLSGEVYWLLDRSPQRLLGQLSDEVRGAWSEGGQVVVNLDGRLQRFSLVDDGLPSLARCVVELWMGAGLGKSISGPAAAQVEFNVPSQLIAA